MNLLPPLSKPMEVKNRTKGSVEPSRHSFGRDEETPVEETTGSREPRPGSLVLGVGPYEIVVRRDNPNWKRGAIHIQIACGSYPKSRRMRRRDESSKGVDKARGLPIKLKGIDKKRFLRLREKKEARLEALEQECIAETNESPRESTPLEAVNEKLSTEPYEIRGMGLDDNEVINRILSGREEAKKKDDFKRRLALLPECVREKERA